MVMHDDGSFDIYLLLRPFRHLVADTLHLLAPLSPLAQKLAVSVEGYYSPTLDAALVALRFDRHLAQELGHARLRSLVAAAEVPMITPEELEFERRCEFYLDHLSNYTTYVRHDRGTAGESLLERVIRHLGEHLAPARAELQRRAMGRFETPAPA